MDNSRYKFRAWDGNKMRYDVTFDEKNIWSRKSACYERANTPLMQYTGLKDRIGREIYEGDIVKGLSDIRTIPCEIKYKNGNWNYSYSLDEWGDDPETEWEIIGNIYENSELLKEA